MPPAEVVPHSHGLVALPLPGGRTRVILHVGAPDDIPGAFALSDVNPVSAAPGGGMQSEGVTSLRSRFGLEAFESVRLGLRYVPAAPKQWFITGGGRHNPAVMKGLKDALGQVYPVESLGWKGDALEAQAFAFLAVRSLKRMPLSLPTTTGATRAVTGGALYRA